MDENFVITWKVNLESNSHKLKILYVSYSLYSKFLTFHIITKLLSIEDSRLMAVESPYFCVFLLKKIVETELCQCELLTYWVVFALGSENYVFDKAMNIQWFLFH